MKSTITWLAWITLGLVAALTSLNWSTMIAPASFDLVVTQVQLPLGLLILALAACPLVLFFVAYLHQQIGALMETRRLLREVHRAHELADKVEASRIEGLRQLLADDFRVINERLDSLGAARPERPSASPGPTARIRQVLSAPWRGEANGR